MEGIHAEPCTRAGVDGELNVFEGLLSADDGPRFIYIGNDEMPTNGSNSRRAPLRKKVLLARHVETLQLRSKATQRRRIRQGRGRRFGVITTVPLGTPRPGRSPHTMYPTATIPDRPSATKSPSPRPRRHTASTRESARARCGFALARGATGMDDARTVGRHHAESMQWRERCRRTTEGSTPRKGQQSS
jgi:hypothetical protein